MLLLQYPFSFKMIALFISAFERICWMESTRKQRLYEDNVHSILNDF